MERNSSRRLAHRAPLVLLASSLALSACSPEPEPGELLRRSFADHAHLVLDGQARFRPDRGAFFLDLDEQALRTDTLSTHSHRVRLSASLPRRAEEPVEIRLAGGAAISVQERGTVGEALAAEQAVAYRRDGGASFWRITQAGLEEWLLVDGLPASGEAGAWEVQGLRLRQHGSAVDLYDEAGVARLTVSAPAAYGGDGRAVPVRLVARGSEVVAVVRATPGERVLVDPAWVPAGSMATDRAWHSATRLLDGRVLAAGGLHNNVVDLSSAELYDPATNTWSPTASMAETRYLHASALLDDGRVFVAGSNTPDGRSVELYDPASETWSPGTPMKDPRGGTTTVLPDGRILVIGWSVLAKTGAEIYNPFEDSWKLTSPMVAPRLYHTASLLANTKVLVTGGNGSFKHSTEIYDIAADTWTEAAPMIVNRAGHTATVLANGDILVAGGTPGNKEYSSSVERYDPGADTWTMQESMMEGRYDHQATLLLDGRVMVMAGQGDFSWALDSVEYYDGSGWTKGPSFVEERVDFSLVQLLDGTFLAVGGETGSAERYATDLPLGAPCGDASGACKSGFCRDGVCCNTDCKEDKCNTCLASKGAPADGICLALSGTPCEDGDRCTENDRCENGVCVSSPPKMCLAYNACYYFPFGECDYLSGICNIPSYRGDTASCPGGTCRSGLCEPPPSNSDGGGGDASFLYASGGGGCTYAASHGNGLTGRRAWLVLLALTFIAGRRSLHFHPGREFVA